MSRGTGNTVNDFYGLDEEKYSNNFPLESYNEGDEVVVFDLGSYSIPNGEINFPIEAVISRIWIGYGIIVTIDGDEYECYNSEFGREFKQEEG